MVQDSIASSTDVYGRITECQGVGVLVGVGVGVGVGASDSDD